MILKRPYAFLIKHFRLIHLIIFGLLVYLTYSLNNILSFFKEYIRLNGNIEVIASNYVNSYIFISAFIIIILSLIIYFLMRYKKKPRLFYIILIGGIILSCIIISYLYSNIKILELSSLGGKEIRLYRDISRINFYILLVLCIPTLIRGLGFDIKKFNFSNDVKQLNLNNEDNEEVELNFDLSWNGLKRFNNKTKRELKYYYQENKTIINIIFTIILLVIFSFGFKKVIIDRDLHEKEVLSTNSFNIKINSSYISERNRISKNNSYVILNISVIGKIDNYKLNLDKLILKTKDKKYIPSLKYYHYFDDLGVGYRENILDTNNYTNYLLIYNVDNTSLSDKIKLYYLDSKRYINLSPTEIE